MRDARPLLPLDFDARRRDGPSTLIFLIFESTKMVIPSSTGDSLDFDARSAAPPPFTSISTKGGGYASDTLVHLNFNNSLQEEGRPQPLHPSSSRFKGWPLPLISSPWEYLHTPGTKMTQVECFCSMAFRTHQRTQYGCVLLFDTIMDVFSSSVFSRNRTRSGNALFHPFSAVTHEEGLLLSSSSFYSDSTRKG
jgi:hypothetical protein